MLTTTPLYYSGSKLSAIAHDPRAGKLQNLARTAQGWRRGIWVPRGSELQRTARKIERAADKILRKYGDVRSGKVFLILADLKLATLRHEKYRYLTWIGNATTFDVVLLGWHMHYRGRHFKDLYAELPELSMTELPLPPTEYLHYADSFSYDNFQHANRGQSSGLNSLIGKYQDLPSPSQRCVVLGWWLEEMENVRIGTTAYVAELLHN